MVKHQNQIELHSEAVAEIEYSKQWYESKSVNLGYDFLSQIAYAIQKIQTDPEIWPLYDPCGNLRKFLVHRFPYAIIYRYRFPIVEIIAVANVRRRPGYWNSRTK